MNHRALCVTLLAAVLLVGGLGCGGDGSSPTQPDAATLTLTTAAVTVDGTLYNGGTYHHGGGHGDSTRFEARLMLSGAPAPGARVWVAYGQGMMGGRFALYDDGTHGDHEPGDGLYCLEDFDGEYGFHHAGAHHGTYHYDFWGELHGMAESNHRGVTVQVLD